VVLLIVLGLAACQPTPPVAGPTPGAAGGSTPTGPAASYPEPSQQGTTPTGEVKAYPGPSNQDTEAAPSSAGVLYPGPASGDTVSWTQAQAMILNGEVKKITQSDSLQFTMDLKDGRSLISSENNEGDLAAIVERCGEPCKDITVEP
jgi:hypothetical protein